MKGSGQENGLAATPCAVRSRFFAPPAEFDGCFTSFYHLELDVPEGVAVNDCLQPEWGNIRFFCGALPWSQIEGRDAVVDARFTATGPSSLPTHFTLGQVRMWGVGFLPLGWARLVDEDASELANQVADGERHAAFRKFAGLADILCDPAVSDQAQYDAIVETMRRLARHHRDEQTILKVHHALLDEELASVGELAERAGLGLRRLERVCTRHFGFPPKLLMRRQRFMRSLTGFMLHKGSKWTEVIDEHYHDQAQFTREFRTFMGMAPSEYAALEHPILASFVEARARIWGSPAQTLDRPR